MFTVGADDPAATRARSELEPEVRRILRELDADGRWVTVHDGKARLVGQPKFAPGFRYLASNVFNHHVQVLSDYVAATRRK